MTTRVQVQQMVEKELISEKGKNKERDKDTGGNGSFSLETSEDAILQQRLQQTSIKVPKEPITRLTTRFKVVPVFKVENLDTEVLLKDNQNVHSNNSVEKSMPKVDFIEPTKQHSETDYENESKFRNKCTDLVLYEEDKFLIPKIEVSNYDNSFVNLQRQYNKSSTEQENYLKPPLAFSDKVPASLMPLVHPRCKVQQVTPAKPSGEIRKNLLKSLHQMPHGATIPPLHEMKGNHRVLVNQILRESRKSIEFGTTDGRNVKIISSLTSSQFRESGSLRRFPIEEEQNVDHDRVEEDGRLHWTKKMHFMISCIGACVGLCSFWRLPYLCLAGGRAAFLLPFTILYCISGIPMMMAEFTIGQFTQRGPVEAFRKICPLMQGIGISNLIFCLYASIYYSLIFSESILSLGVALGNLPTFCNSSSDVRICAEETIAITDDSKNYSENYYREVVTVADDLNPETTLVITFTIIGSWIVVFFALWKSVRSIGKVTSVSATVPFVLIAIFVWRAVTLPGATVGLQYFFTPDWSKILELEVWVNAAVQVFVSLNIVFGSSLTFASYNKFLNNIESDVFHISWISYVSSLVAVLVVFCGLGNIAVETGFDINNINYDGADWAFVIYPRMLTKMPRMHIWVAMFYLLLFLLGLDSQFASVEVMVTSFKENAYKCCKWLKVGQELAALIVCVICLGLSLLFVLPTAPVSLYLSDVKMISIGILFLASCQSATLFWIYGSAVLGKNLRQMTGKRTSSLMMICWKFITPLSFMILWVLSIVCYTIEVDRVAAILGWVFIGLSLMPIPLCGLGCYLFSEGDSPKKKLRNSLTPRLDPNNATRFKYHVRNRTSVFPHIQLPLLKKLSQRSDNSPTVKDIP